jgi:hypothetical protein
MAEPAAQLEAKMAQIETDCNRMKQEYHQATCGIARNPVAVAPMLERSQARLRVAYLLDLEMCGAAYGAAR